MNTGNRHTAPYYAADIERYRKGELSAREMHDLELAALDDPFLADAMEGLMEQTAAQDDLADLRQRLELKVKEGSRRRGIALIQRRLTIAAAVILLLGIGYTFFLRHPDRPATFTERAVVARPPAPPAVTRPASAPASRADTDRAVAAMETVRPRHNNKKAKSAAGDIAQNAPAGYVAEKTPALSSAQAIMQHDSISTDLARNSNVLLNDKKYLADSTVFKSAPLVYSGKVLDLQNRPVAGAFLAFKGNNTLGYFTDDKGQFQLSLHPRDTTRQLTVSSVGYDHAYLSVNELSTDDATNNVIHLKPSTADLNEVVVVGYGMHRKAMEAAAPSRSDEKLDTLWMMAVPAIGRQAYLQYLTTARKKLGLDSTITGTEIVSFIVSRDGKLSSFKIEQSLSPAHDAGLIRLITDGPAWILLRGKNVRAAVSVTF